MAARQLSIALLFAASAVLAAKPLVREVTDDIDTSFGQDDAPLATEKPAAVPVAATQAHPTNSAAPPTLDSSSEPDDEPFDNVLNPEFSTERHWSLEASSGYAGTDWDTTTVTNAVGLSRSFDAASASLTPRLGWYRQSTQPDKQVANSFVAGAYASWQPIGALALGLDGEWTFQTGIDDWSTTADLSYSHEFTEWFASTAEVWGGWSKSSRGLAGASLSSRFAPGDFLFSAQGNWNYRMEQLINKARYLHVWGWASSALWKHGRWTLGPVWNGEYWSAAARTPKNGSSIKTSSKASGEQLTQNVGLSFGWKPVSAIRFDLDVVRNFGTTNVSVTRTNLKAKNAAKRTTQRFLMPDNSLGATIALGFDW